jgi:hypothetical protein
MKHEKLFGVLAITMLVVTIGIAEARINTGLWKSRPHMAGLNIQGGTNITNAIKANDYSAWQAAMNAQITQDNFNKQVQFYQQFITNHTNSTHRRGNITLWGNKTTSYTAWARHGRFNHKTT